MTRRTYITLGAAAAIVAFTLTAIAASDVHRLRAAPGSKHRVGLRVSKGPAPGRKAPDPAANPTPTGPPLVGKLFYADRVTPYFGSGKVARALGLIRQKKFKKAEPLLMRYKPAPGEQPRIHFLLAYTWMKQRRLPEAAALFDSLRQSYAALAQHATFYAARCHYLGGARTAALALSRKVTGKGPLARRALLLQGDVLRAMGRHGDAARVYETFLKRHGGPGQAEASLRLAESLLRDPAAKGGRIVQLLHRAWALAPGIWSVKARALLPRALGRVRSPRRRAGLTRPTCHQVLQRTVNLAKKRKLRDANRALLRARRRRGCRKVQLCRAYTAVGRLLARKRRHRRQALRTLLRAIHHCQPTRLHGHKVKAKYAAAKVYARLGRTRAALAMYRRVEREHPTHSYADDARFRAARVLLRRSDKLRKGRRRTALRRKAVRLLSTLHRRYPKGDMVQDALWHLAWKAYGQGNLSRALALFTRAAKSPAKTPRTEDEGRARYWRARTLERLGRSTEAETAYQTVVKKHPLTWYALLALVRLERGAPAQAAALLAWLRARPTRAAWRFGPDKVYARPGFARAVELARLGLGQSAARELHGLGIISPVRRPGEKSLKPATLPNQRQARQKLQRRKQRLWAAAVLYDRAGLHDRSHWMVKKALRDYAQAPPSGANQRLWRISYPLAFADLVTRHARKNQLPEALVYGLMREESAFNPRLVSHANAVGLMQLLQITAKRFRVDRRRISKATLRRPAVNIPIGTNYLGWLKKLFHGHLVPTVAAYNAGETQIARWLVKRGKLPVDQFVEEIPFRETRRYVKRVLTSATAYHALSGAPKPLLKLPLTFSAALLSEARSWQKKAATWRRWILRKRARERRARARLRKARRRKARRRKARPRKARSGLRPIAAPRARPSRR